MTSAQRVARVPTPVGKRRHSERAQRGGISLQSPMPLRLRLEHHDPLRRVGRRH